MMPRRPAAARVVALDPLDALDASPGALAPEQDAAGRVELGLVLARVEVVERYHVLATFRASCSRPRERRAGRGERVEVVERHLVLAAPGASSGSRGSASRGSSASPPPPNGSRCPH
jgi:hypothetical protein